MTLDIHALQVSGGVSCALSGHVPVEGLTALCGSRRKAEDEAWKAKTARADAEAANSIGR